MSLPAFKSEYFSVFDPIPVADLKAELAKFEHMPPYLSVGQAAKVMMVTSPGARVLHERCEKIDAGRNEVGHRLFRRDGCVAYRWSRLTFSSFSDTEAQGGWDVE